MATPHTLTGSGDQVYEVVQIVPKPIAEVFSFFSDATNLEVITPPWLHFHVLGKSTPGIQEGTLIDYELKVHGIPIRWQSKITEWMPNEKFADVQMRGPYRKWHHTHLFEAVANGTRMTDRVRYQVAFGVLGQMMVGKFVRTDIEKIFAYRRECIERRYGVA